jgi:hypothetical protein
MAEFNPLAPEFVPWPKIPRLNRDIIITEKIDGSKAAVGILDDGTVYAQSRKKLITPESDNFGFARWVKDNEIALRLLLGPGLHFGEWWGQGIQRRYDMDRKVFSLFNVNRWSVLNEEPLRQDCERIGLRTVPVLYEGPFSEVAIKSRVEELATLGSLAAPYFPDPEGIIVFHTALNGCFKVTIKDDEKPKGSTE